MFTVPAGGAGLYYFNTHVTGADGEYSWFHLKKNDVTLCSMLPDANNGGNDHPAASCAATVELNEGNINAF